MHRAAALLFSLSALSAQSIQYSDSRKIWLLTTRQNSYAMGLGEDGALHHIYWGAPLWRTDDLAAPPARRDVSSFDPRQMLEAEEFPGWDGPRYYEPALKITRQSRSRPTLHFPPNQWQRPRYRTQRFRRPYRSHAPLPRLSRPRRPAPQFHHSQFNSVPSCRGKRAVRHLEPAPGAKDISSPISPDAGLPRLR